MDGGSHHCRIAKRERARERERGDRKRDRENEGKKKREREHPKGSTKSPPCVASLSCTHALTLHACSAHFLEDKKVKAEAAMHHILFDLKYKQTHLYNIVFGCVYKQIPRRNL